VKDPGEAHPESRVIPGGGGAAPEAVSRNSGLASAALGSLLGGIAGGAFAVGVTLVLKAMMDVVSTQAAWLVILIPLLGLALGVLVLLRFGPIEPVRVLEPGAKPAPVAARRARGWALLRTGSVQADITGDIVATAGQEEQFPWRHAPARAAAIIATVGFGAAMGTEAPAAYLGVAGGACLGDRGRWWRRLLRPAALSGGAAGVAALMGIPLVGTAYLLELGRRNNAPFSPDRILAALIGGLVGWGINVAFDLNLIRLVVPKEPPVTLAQAVITALFIGGISGGIGSLSGIAIYRAKKWEASPGVRLVLGALALAAVRWLLRSSLSRPPRRVRAQARFSGRRTRTPSPWRSWPWPSCAQRPPRPRSRRADAGACSCPSSPSETSAAGSSPRALASATILPGPPVRRAALRGDTGCR
jgi:H+/Cl- antiporter ClcA